MKKHIEKDRLYGDKLFEVCPVKVEDGATYYDHLVDGKSVMRREVRNLLEEFLRKR